MTQLSAKTQTQIKSRYLLPESKTNPNPFWTIPEPAQLVEDLRLCGGSIRSLLATVAGEHDQKLLVEILLQLNSSKDCLQAWEKLQETHERAALMLIEAELLDSALTSANKQKAAEFLLPKRLPRKYGKDGLDAGINSSALLDQHIQELEEEEVEA